MNFGIESYLDLFSSFLSGDASAHEFQRVYLERFKSEKSRFEEKVYSVLDALFGDVDAFTDDTDLLSENPQFYLDERALRERVGYAARELRTILGRD